MVCERASLQVLKSWAEAEWFLSRPEVPKKITTTVFFVKVRVAARTHSARRSDPAGARARPQRGGGGRRSRGAESGWAIRPEELTACAAALRTMPVLAGG